MNYFQLISFICRMEVIFQIAEAWFCGSNFVFFVTDHVSSLLFSIFECYDPHDLFLSLLVGHLRSLIWLRSD